MNEHRGGEYRKQDVYVTRDDNEIFENRVFIPPKASRLPYLMRHFTEYYNRAEDEDNVIDHPFIKSSIAHFLFLHIHPFVDGNGRMSRALAHSKLWKSSSKRFINTKQPVLFMSHGYKRNIMTYFKNLGILDENLDDSNAWNGWFKFQLDMMTEQTYYLTNAVEEIGLEPKVPRPKSRTKISKIFS